jgi:hypothetical protein
MVFNMNISQYINVYTILLMPIKSVSFAIKPVYNCSLLMLCSTCVVCFQQQYGYQVIQMLMSHLDSHMKDNPNIKASIIEVLFESVLISAGGSIGQTSTPILSLSLSLSLSLTLPLSLSLTRSRSRAR